MINHTTKTIDCWWAISPRPGNFGDILTPFIIQTLSGYTAKYSPLPLKAPTFLAVGSIIGQTTSLTTVWGSGIISKLTKPDTNARYLAVRGPITREHLLHHGIYAPEVYGDPALLLPKLYYPRVTKKYKIGIFGHYVDTEQLKKWYPNNPDIKIIDPINKDITKVIDDIVSCDQIVSSSLHGLITAHAYGIPAAWVKISSKLFGDDSKFYDYFESVNIQHNYSTFADKKSITELNMLPYTLFDKFDCGPLLGAYPLPIIDNI